MALHGRPLVHLLATALLRRCRTISHVLCPLQVEESQLGGTTTTTTSRQTAKSASATATGGPAAADASQAYGVHSGGLLGWGDCVASAAQLLEAACTAGFAAAPAATGRASRLGYRLTFRPC